ncbi:hypothetical protein ACH9L7_10365 [Haloferax sp. S1W]|uniref:hypothetical protein n=1 Tax=Haloferax sp. S1W TaxID=3377110 RepID=UPI0037C50A11
MSDTPSPAGMAPCSTTSAALAEYGLSDGNTLIRRTYYALVEDGFGTTEPTDAYLGRVAETFRALFVELTGASHVPADIDAAIDDARYATFDSVDDDADLRTTVLPAFNSAFAGYYCRYRGRPLAPDT